MYKGWVYYKIKKYKKCSNISYESPSCYFKAVSGGKIATLSLS